MKRRLVALAAFAILLMAVIARGISMSTGARDFASEFPQKVEATWRHGEEQASAVLEQGESGGITIDAWGMRLSGLPIPSYRHDGHVVLGMVGSVDGGPNWAVDMRIPDGRASGSVGGTWAFRLVTDDGAPPRSFWVDLLPDGTCNAARGPVDYFSLGDEDASLVQFASGTWSINKNPDGTGSTIECSLGEDTLSIAFYGRTV